MRLQWLHLIASEGFGRCARRRTQTKHEKSAVTPRCKAPYEAGIEYIRLDCANAAVSMVANWEYHWYCPLAAKPKDNMSPDKIRRGMGESGLGRWGALVSRPPSRDNLTSLNTQKPCLFFICGASISPKHVSATKEGEMLLL